MHPTVQQLENGLEHVLYEIRQFLDTGRVLLDDRISLCWPVPKAKRGTSTPWTVVNPGNYVLESFLVHTRTLREFFCRSLEKREQQDDILAADYKFCNRQWNVVSSHQTKINKHLAHLTYSRTTGYSWPNADFACEILPCCRAFLDHLVKKKYISTDDTEKKLKCQELVEDIDEFLEFLGSTSLNR